MARLDPFIKAYYERGCSEQGRLWDGAKGELVRLRTWGIFERYLPEPAVAPRVIDIGGGPGVHAAHLAERGYEVTLVDPLPLHVEQARARAASATGQQFRAEEGDARQLGFGDESFDIVLLMGPLYHLVERADRDLALGEARRVLRPGGVLLGEIVTRRAWLMDATVKGLLGTPGIFDDFEVNQTVGTSCERAKLEAAGSGFWAHFHDIDEVALEFSTAGFAGMEMVAVEGFAWLVGNLGVLLAGYRQELLRAVATTEKDRHLLGASPHVDVIARRP